MKISRADRPTPAPVLTQSEQGLMLTSLDPALHPYQVDFNEGKLYYRYTHLQGRNELIAKAVGWKKQTPLQIFDVTAGFGRDAFLLAALGCEVTLFERHPIIAALLKEGIERATHHPDLSSVMARMHLIEECAIHYLKHTALTTRPDVIYCDPMFPPRIKSAAVKKEMQLLQAVVGENNDADQLVALALKTATKRVVVKRAQHAPPLHAKPHLVFSGRSHRFDVYLI